jgi:hypothetical protein
VARDQKKLDEWDKKLAAAQTEQEKIAIVEEIRTYVREQEIPKDAAEIFSNIVRRVDRELSKRNLSEDERAALVHEIVSEDK